MSSINFYASIDKTTSDPKDNEIIVIKAPGKAFVGKSELLRELKSYNVVRVVFESAQVDYQQDVDAETSIPTKWYEKDDNGVWQEREAQGISLDLDGVEKTDKVNTQITADIVDNFLLSQNYEYDAVDGFEPRTVLSEIAEGTSFSDIAEKLGMSVTDMLDNLNTVRERFAPYAEAWMKLTEANDNED